MSVDVRKIFTKKLRRRIFLRHSPGLRTCLIGNEARLAGCYCDLRDIIPTLLESLSWITCHSETWAPVVQVHFICSKFREMPERLLETLWQADLWQKIRFLRNIFISFSWSRQKTLGFDTENSWPAPCQVSFPVLTPLPWSYRWTVECIPEGSWNPYSTVLWDKLHICFHQNKQLPLCLTSPHPTWRLHQPNAKTKTAGPSE